MEDSNIPKIIPVNVQKDSGIIREIHLRYNIVTNKLDVQGHIMDKLVCYQMLIEAGHIILSMPVPMPAPPGGGNGKAA
jgi:hypothetical protein